MQNTTDPSEPPSSAGRMGSKASDGIDRQGLRALDQLAGLSLRLEAQPADGATRELAADLLLYFSAAAWRVDDIWRRDALAGMSAIGDPEVILAIKQLGRDRERIARDWLEIEPHLQAVAAGQLWYDIDVIREGTAVFVALMRDHDALKSSIFRVRGSPRYER